MNRTLTLRVATINVPWKVGPADWRECYDETTARADLFGVQECGTPAQRRTYITEARAHGDTHFGLSLGPNPTFWDPDVMDRTAGKQYLLHGPGVGRLARLYPGFNASRYATLTVHHMQAPEHADAPPVVFINTHLIPRGRKVLPRFRRRARAKSDALLRAKVKAHTDAGRIVVVVGDMNDDEGPNIGVTWVWENGVDMIGVALPHGVRLAAESAGRYPAPTDHAHGVRAVLTFTY